MKRKQNLYVIAALIGLMMLIFDSSTAIKGASTGIELCIRTVIPSLFPFFVISMFLTSILTEQEFTLLQWLSNVMKMPQRAAQVLIPAFLGGYPVGAKCVGDLYRSCQIDKRNAETVIMCTI